MYKLVIALLLFSSVHVQAQTLNFKLVLFNDSVGHETISKTHNADGSESYVMEEHIKAKVLWITRENISHYESVYRDGKMVSANYYEINNGKKDKWSNIKYDGKVYQVDNYHGKSTFTEAPTHSIGTMYCDPYSPGRKRFFFEPEADFNDLKFPEPNTVEFKGSDGNKNVYHFKNGQIADAEFHTTIATVYLKRIK